MVESEQNMEEKLWLLPTRGQGAGFWLSAWKVLLKAVDFGEEGQ